MDMITITIKITKEAHAILSALEEFYTAERGVPVNKINAASLALIEAFKRRQPSAALAEIREEHEIRQGD
jgi:hypothetical protein